MNCRSEEALSPGIANELKNKEAQAITFTLSQARKDANRVGSDGVGSRSMPSDTGERREHVAAAVEVNVVRGLAN